MRDVLRDIAGLRWSLGIDAAIARLAALQHGVVARWQLKLVGITDDAIDFRVARGRLHRVTRGVYSVGQPIVSHTGRRAASVLTFGDDAVSSHKGAGAHWGITVSSALEVTVPRTVRGRRGITVHCLPLPADEVTTHGGIPITTVVRTIFDLGIYGRRTVERAIHEAEHRQLHDRLTLDDLLGRYPNRKGAATIRAVLRESLPGGTENDFEEDFLAFLLERGFPVPRVNAWIEVGGTLIRPDVVFDAERVVVELDGGTHATPSGRRKDNRRDAALQASGWYVFRVSWHAFYFARGEVEADLRRLLSAGRPTFSVT